MNEQARPTARQGGRFDLSPVVARASGEPASSEAALFVGYRGVTLIEERPCVCGGIVHADPVRPAPGVAAHQYTGRHRAWRSNHEAEAA